ncbi:uncharacterized protein LOC113795479 [Dermatophagoides pteronyssinus]|uniref:uncharacterized protein LOC113795479 n=1 Tax=Dermatophagoides pteronyssinus TaxID=6956 RepID=UPI003F669B90
MDLGFFHNLALAGTDQLGCLLIFLTLLILVYGPFVLWYSDGWYRTMVQFSKWLKSKDSTRSDGADEQKPQASRLSLDLRVTKPLKLNLRRLVVTQSDLSERRARYKIGRIKFGVIPPPPPPPSTTTTTTKTSEQKN